MPSTALLVARPFAAAALLLSLSPAASAQGQPAPASTAPPPATVEVPRLPGPDSQVSEAAVPVERVTFEQAVQRTLAKNPTIVQAAEEIRRYHALMEEVRSASLPVLNAVGAYTRLDSNRLEAGRSRCPWGC